MKNDKTEPIPVMDYRQYRRARRLVHECCNYIDGNCIALDDGEECVCVQSISYSLLCRWFRTAILPQDKELETALFHRMNAKKCAVCEALFTKEMRLELTRHNCHHPLKVARLPIPPFLQKRKSRAIVPRTGLEPACLSTHAPETCASTIPPPGHSV